MNLRNVRVNRSHTPRSYLAGHRTSEATVRPYLAYVEAAKLDAWLRTSRVHPLAIVSFGQSAHSHLSCPTVTLDLPQLNGPPMLEVWYSDQPVETPRLIKHGSLAISGDVLAGCLSFEEQPGTALDATAESAYKQLLRLLRDFEFPYLWRLWNFFPGINDHANGLERYRQFCMGRHHALAESLPDFPASLPAGTAVGTQSGPLQIYFFAGAHPVIHLGNPRQLNAYEYPQDYGPRSPSFARATLCRSDSGSQLFIAGTASVVGHASRHLGRPTEQTEETIRNLRSLVDHAEGLLEPNEIGASPRSMFKVYVRHPEHLASIRQVLHDPLLTSSQLLFFKGDLCRQELLVEIEGLIALD